MYEYKAKVLRVIDGDTIEVSIELGFNISIKEKIRLLRVNTAETHGVKKDSEEYKNGIAATEFVEKWISENNGYVLLKTEKDHKGKYGRYLAEVFSLDSGENLQDRIISEGFDKNTLL